MQQTREINILSHLSPVSLKIGLRLKVRKTRQVATAIDQFVRDEWDEQD